MQIRTLWLVVAGLIGPATLAAQNPPPPATPDAPRPLRQRVHQPLGAPGFMMYSPDRLVDRREVLKLTPDQVSRLEALAQEERRARDPADSAARAHEEQLATLWDAPQPDVRAIETHLRAAGEARQTALVATARAAARAKAVLTPEQQGRVAGWRDGARAMRGRAPRPDRPGPRRPEMGLRRG
jgi:Spy/CpxP family protein refolding chaperone